MEFIDLEALGRYIKDCQQKIKTLSMELERCRRGIKDRDAQIQKLQAILLRHGMVTYSATDGADRLRRFPR